ncbi:hypothetical protein B0H14DRAFT_2644979 [Mycena olivaceomarginata]|nr:hypothetical protein B0H14DRAFT_2644979 [Mycena olivaceomarginata]
MFAPKPRPAVPQPTPSEPPTATEVTPADMVDYLSEHSDSDEDGSGSDEVDEHEPPNTSSSHRVYCRSKKGGGQGSQSNTIRPIMPPTTCRWRFPYPESRPQRESPYEKPPPKTPTPSPSTLRPSTSRPKPRSAYPGTRTNADAQSSSRAAPTTGPEKALTGAEYLRNISTRCVVEEILKKFPHPVPERRLLWDSISKRRHWHQVAICEHRFLSGFAVWSHIENQLQSFQYRLSLVQILRKVQAQDCTGRPEVLGGGVQGS